MNTHTGEKPHLCKHCGAAFASKGTCHMHECTVHLGHSRYISEDQLEARKVDDKNESHFSPRNCISFYLKLVCTYSLPGTVLLFFSKQLIPILSQELYFPKRNWRLENMQQPVLSQGLYFSKRHHEKLLDFKCEYCGKEFASFIEITCHVRTIHHLHEFIYS